MRSGPRIHSDPVIGMTPLGLSLTSHVLPNPAGKCLAMASTILVVTYFYWQFKEYRWRRSQRRNVVG
jgi:hypothetical protein